MGATMPINLPIEDWDGEPTLRLPEEVLQQLNLQVGDSLYLVEAWGGDGPRLVLSKTPMTPDLVDALVAQWERELAEEQAESAPAKSSHRFCAPERSSPPRPIAREARAGKETRPILTSKSRSCCARDCYDCRRVTFGERRRGAH